MSIKSDIIKAANKAIDFGSKNAPAILTACAVVSTIGAVVTAVKGTISAVQTVQNEKADIEKDLDEIIQQEIAEGKLETASQADERLEELMKANYTWKDVVKSVWPYYIPSLCLSGMAIGCAIGSQTLNSRRQAATFALYEAAQSTLKTYQEKVLEEVGKNKEKKIRHATNEELLKKDPPKEDNVYNCHKGRCGVENGEALFREPHTGQYFVSTYEKVRRAVRKCNSECHKDSWYQLSDLIDDMGGDPTATGLFNFGFPGTPDGAQDVIDEEYLFDPHMGEYMDHEVTVVYMNYIAVDREKYNYAL